MTENAALEGEVSQLTYEVSLIKCYVTTGIHTIPIDYYDTFGNMEKCHCKKQAAQCVSVTNRCYPKKGELGIPEYVTVSNRLFTLSL